MGRAVAVLPAEHLCHLDTPRLPANVVGRFGRSQWASPRELKEHRNKTGANSHSGCWHPMTCEFCCGSHTSKLFPRHSTFKKSKCSCCLKKPIPMRSVKSWDQPRIPNPILDNIWLILQTDCHFTWLMPIVFLGSLGQLSSNFSHGAALISRKPTHYLRSKYWAVTNKDAFQENVHPIFSKRCD